MGAPISHPEEDLDYSCPYCSQAQSLRIDRTGGSRQRFITDCENCCRPIEIEVEIEADGYVNFYAKREGEG